MKPTWLSRRLKPQTAREAELRGLTPEHPLRNFLRSIHLAKHPYLTTFFVVLFAAIVRETALAPLGTQVQFITFYPSIAICALVGGASAGMLATFLSMAFAYYFWIAPTNPLLIAEPTEQLMNTAFCIGGLLMSVIVGRARAVERRAREQVEREVAARTKDLSEATWALEQELGERQAAKRQFQQVVASAPNALLVVNSAGIVELANRQAEVTFGYSFDELQGLFIDKLLPERSRTHHDAHRAAFHAAPRQRTMGAGQELFALLKDGREIAVEVGISPLNTVDGVKVIASVVDITKRKAIEHALAESEQQMRLIFDNIRDHAILMLDVDGRILTWNAGAEILKGYGRDEIVGKNYSVFFAPEDIGAELPQRLLKAAALEGHAETEGLRLRQDGSQFLANVTLNAVKNPQGQLVAFVKVTRDFTERRRLEGQLRETNQRFAVAADAARLGFWNYNLVEQTIDWDEQMFRLYGHEKAAGGEPYDFWTRHLHPEDRARAEQEVQAAASGDFKFDTEFRIVKSDGEVRHLRAAASVKRDESGRPVQMIGVNFDVTARKEAELALHSARDAAEAANRAKSEFLAIMSHEIRTPMNGIMGMNALLLQTQLTEKQREMNETIRFSAESLLSIIDDILDIARLEAKKSDLEDIDFELRPLFEKAVQLLAPRGEQKGLTISVEIGALSQTGLRGDPVRLRQIVLNFLSNAIKFTQVGGVTVAASATELGEGRTRLRCEVRDTGAGIGDDAKTRLFQPFEQADKSITRQFGGSGLGLSICKKLVELMDGHIGVFDRPGGGSVFWFEVNLHHAEAGFVEGAKRDSDEDKMSVAQHAGRILLAEDNAVNVKVATMILETAGYTVVVAIDGLRAVEAMRAGRYDLVLMDMHMPGLDGLSATREIRKLRGGAIRVPIVAMTANAMKEDRLRCLDAGMDDYISKPFRPKMLLDCVAGWMAKSASAQAASTVEEDSDDIGSLPVVDWERLGELTASFPADQVSELLTFYLAKSDRQIEILSRLKPTLALVEMASEAHKYRGSAGMFGVRQVQELSRRLENACLAGDDVVAAALCDQLVGASARSVEVLRSRFAFPHEAAVRTAS